MQTKVTMQTKVATMQTKVVTKLQFAFIPPDYSSSFPSLYLLFASLIPPIYSPQIFSFHDMEVEKESCDYSTTPPGRGE